MQSAGSSVPGVTLKRPVPKALSSFGEIMECGVFFPTDDLSLPCQSLLVAASPSGQSYFFAPAIAVKLTFTYPKQLAGI